ncbi:hypothetical protein [Acinetobacter sp. WZC-1]|uniref:hypothetical protein n=1 Tax=Acinetobacter sp. WZC-1 TaxID=3459034 RepID=UPI00403E0BDC
MHAQKTDWVHHTFVFVRISSLMGNFVQISMMIFINFLPNGKNFSVKKQMEMPLLSDMLRIVEHWLQAHCP